MLTGKGINSINRAIDATLNAQSARHRAQIAAKDAVIEHLTTTTIQVPHLMQWLKQLAAHEHNEGEIRDEMHTKSIIARLERAIKAGKVSAAQPTESQPK